MTGGSTKTQTPPAVSMTEEDKELSGTPRQGHGGLPCEPDGETVEATATLCGTQKAVKRPGNCPRRTGIERGVSRAPSRWSPANPGTARRARGASEDGARRPLSVPWSRLRNAHTDGSPRSMTTIVSGRSEPRATREEP